MKIVQVTDRCRRDIMTSTPGVTVKKGTWLLKEKLPQSPAEDEDSVRILDPDAKVTAATKVKRF